MHMGWGMFEHELDLSIIFEAQTQIPYNLPVSFHPQPGVPVWLRFNIPDMCPIAAGTQNGSDKSDHL
jgi:hypothetical protein